MNANLYVLAFDHLGTFEMGRVGILADSAPKLRHFIDVHEKG